ncbi:hypothetical protein HPB51_022471 [Rhipicephalus microplus]|uniref:Uncharacterized protein n=1 Tax=Rhipicephalus microplus TaxID=6941 RepID=A0A9J6DCS1_RHIMP|nr:hypothetical protein HPB51_022471 [Rhipicephalus microplus]
MEERLLFWSNAGEWPRIERFDLETKERQIIVQEQLFQVSDLTLDLKHDLLYWCDLGTARIEQARLDGTGRTRIGLNKGPNRHYSPVSVAVFQSVLFWIDRKVLFPFQVREEKGGPNLDDGHDPMGPGGVFGLPY